MSAQIHERLLLLGHELSMPYCPGFPLDTGEIVKVERKAFILEHYENRDLVYRILDSTGCYREYIGTWEVNGKKLFLKELVGLYRKTSPKPLFAEWVTGILPIIIGRCIKSETCGFLSVYEREIHIVVQNGRVASIDIIKNLQPRVQ